jgi:hypothetical protein
MADFKVNIPTEPIIKHFKDGATTAQKWLDNEVLKDCDPYVPMATGNLRNSGIRGTQIGSGNVVYNAPYAASCYYAESRTFSKSKHPQASAQWFEKAKAVNAESWRREAAKLVKGGG